MAVMVYDYDNNKKRRTSTSPKIHRRWILLTPLLCCCSPVRQPHLAGASSAEPTAARSSTRSPPRQQAAAATNSSFFDKFEFLGPALTLTLRNPSSTTLLRGSADGVSDTSLNAWAWRKLPASSGRGSVPSANTRPSTAAAEADAGTFGLSSKIAAYFHISPSPSPAASSKHGQTSVPASQFADGYMRDDGGICLDPPSSASGATSSRGMFSMQELARGIFGGDGSSWWGSRKSWTDCAENVHPELRFEMKTKEPMRHASHHSNGHSGDTRPFPASAPWLSGMSCGMRWTPFPIYKTGYPEGFGHKLLSIPHFIRYGCSLSLPSTHTMVRTLRSTSSGITNNFTMENDGESRPATKQLEVDVTHRESPYSPGSGTLELSLGRPSPSLPAVSTVPPSHSSSNHNIHNQFRVFRSEETHHGRSHLLVRLATGRKGKTTRTKASPNRNTSILSSIEYAKGSFRMPVPFSLRQKFNNNGGGVSVSPSFDFAEGTARCVFSGNVGETGRTRAVLRLDAGGEDSTLTVVRAIDESTIIAPTISLASGKIVYDYYLALAGRSPLRRRPSSLRAHVDPTQGIQLKWTDGHRDSWVAECRIPLGTTAAGPWAADVRVGRRWVM